MTRGKLHAQYMRINKPQAGNAEQSLQVHPELPTELILLSSEHTSCPHYVQPERLDPGPMGRLQGTLTLQSCSWATTRGGVAEACTADVGLQHLHGTRLLF